MMKKSRILGITSIAAFSALTGCSSWQESAYYAGQSAGQHQCQKNPTANCPAGESYDAYQRQLKAAAPGQSEPAK